MDQQTRKDRVENEYMRASLGVGSLGGQHENKLLKMVKPMYIWDRTCSWRRVAVPPTPPPPPSPFVSLRKEEG